MGRHYRLAAAALIAATVLTACDSDPPPQSTPTSTSQKTTSTNPSAQAPPVKQPLDASRFHADACQGLTELQRRTLALPDGTSDGSGFCRFTTDNFELLVDLKLWPNSQEGLGRLYQRHSTGEWKYWVPTEVDGYPAVMYQDNPSTIKEDCYIAVGISDSAFFDIRYALSDADLKGKSPCAEGRAVASAVLSTIKAGR